MTAVYTPKCVLITGATSDIGTAIAKRFDQLGCKLVLHGRSQEKLQALSKEINSEHHLMVFDCMDEVSIQTAFDSLPEEFKEVDLLVNNAGGARGAGKFQESDLKDAFDMVTMNITSLVSVTYKALQGMVERARGHIINIGSIAGSYPYPGGHVYCGSKAFVLQFSLALRADLDGTNVRVTNIEPGMVETSFSLKRYHGDVEKAASVYADTTPLVAEDIADNVVYAATVPEHVNINRLEVMPQPQAPAGLKVVRSNG